MKFKLVALGLWLTVVAASPTAARAQAATPSASIFTRPALAVLDFDFAAPQERGAVIQRAAFGAQPAPSIETMNVGKGIADLLVTELVSQGDLRVLERQRMTEVAREQQGGAGTKARYLVMGAVTKFSGEQKNKAGAGVVMGLLSLATHVPMMGAVSVKESAANVDLSCRIVDTATGEIVGTAQGSGSSHRKGLGLGGFGGSGRGAGGGALNILSTDFQATILGEATVAAVREVAENLRSVLIRLKADTTETASGLSPEP